MKIAYICDGKRCERCSDSCHHTLDINHAKNFEKLCDDAGNVLAYEERDAVSHAKWIQGEFGLKCSDCGCYVFYRDKFDQPWESPYCPICGARMDAVPVRHGKWIRDEFGARCSDCGLYAYRDKFDQPWESPYCPICGARMDSK